MTFKTALSTLAGIGLVAGIATVNVPSFEGAKTECVGVGATVNYGAEVPCDLTPGQTIVTHFGREYVDIYGFEWIMETCEWYGGYALRESVDGFDCSSKDF